MNIEAIGHVTSCFKEKFTTPRQSGLASSSDAIITICEEYSNFDAFCDLVEFEYIWVIFYFHLNDNKKGWYPKVRPPRLGGNKKVSVFATRSPFRPNPIGLSLVKLQKVYQEKSKVLIEISGHDLVEGTPVLDIKPFHPEADIVNSFKNGWIDQVNGSRLQVDFNLEIEDKVKEKLSQVLSLDPRPSYHEDENRIYGSFIDDYNVSWKYENNKIIVLNMTKRKNK